MLQGLSSRRILLESTVWLFPEYEFGKINPRTHSYVIMERILERGMWSEVKRQPAMDSSSAKTRCILTPARPTMTWP